MRKIRAKNNRMKQKKNMIYIIINEMQLVDWCEIILTTIPCLIIPKCSDKMCTFGKSGMLLAATIRFSSLLCGCLLIRMRDIFSLLSLIMNFSAIRWCCFCCDALTGVLETCLWLCGNRTPDWLFSSIDSEMWVLLKAPERRLNIWETTNSTVIPVFCSNRSDSSYGRLSSDVPFTESIC